MTDIDRMQSLSANIVNNSAGVEACDGRDDEGGGHAASTAVACSASSEPRALTRLGASESHSKCAPAPRSWVLDH